MTPSSAVANLSCRPSNCASACRMEVNSKRRLSPVALCGSQQAAWRAAQRPSGSFRSSGHWHRVLAGVAATGYEMPPDGCVGEVLRGYLLVGLAWAPLRLQSD
jgi:hypothetical protein